MTGPLEIKTLGELELVVTRSFAAPPEFVFDAWTKPELLQRWLGVHADWSMPACEVDLRVGGAYVYGWRNSKGAGMTSRGVFLEIERPRLIVSTERFDDPWYPGESVNTLLLEPEGDGTRSTLTMRFETPEIRDAVAASPMDTGIENGFVALDGLYGAARL